MRRKRERIKLKIKSRITSRKQRSYEINEPGSDGEEVSHEEQQHPKDLTLASLVARIGMFTNFCVDDKVLVGDTALREVFVVAQAKEDSERTRDCEFLKVFDFFVPRTSGTLRNIRNQSPRWRESRQVEARPSRVQRSAAVFSRPQRSFET